MSIFLFFLFLNDCCCFVFVEKNSLKQHLNDDKRNSFVFLDLNVVNSTKSVLR